LYTAVGEVVHEDTAGFITLLGNHIHADEPEMLALFVDAIRTEAPQLFELSRRCMSADSVTLQEASKNEIASSLESSMTGVLFEQVKRFVDFKADLLGQLLGGRWVARVEVSLRWHLLVDELLAREYSDELDMIRYRYRDLHSGAAMHKEVEPQWFQEDWLWRGLAIHAAAFEGLRRAQTEPYVLSPEFLHWAGTHQDPLSAIEVTKERGTLDIRILQSALDNNGTVHPLYDGNL
jgi:hypothetical protein